MKKIVLVVVLLLVSLNNVFAKAYIDKEVVMEGSTVTLKFKNRAKFRKLINDINVVLSVGNIARPANYSITRRGKISVVLPFLVGFDQGKGSMFASIKVLNGAETLEEFCVIIKSDTDSNLSGVDEDCIVDVLGQDTGFGYIVGASSDVLGSIPEAIAGPQGPMGPQGPAGPQGARGPVGPEADVLKQLTSSDKVGIGVTNPTEALEVSGNIVAANEMMSIAGTNRFHFLKFGLTRSDIRSSISVADSGVASANKSLFGLAMAYDENSSINNAGYTRHNGQINPNGLELKHDRIRFIGGQNGLGQFQPEERMTILNNGSVGIDQPSPQAKLEVNGGIRPGIETADPCSTPQYPEGTMFYNDNDNIMCYCNDVGAVQLHNPANTCF